MNRWKLFLILILAVVLLHILIIKIFIIGSSETPGDKKNIMTESADGRHKTLPEPELPEFKRKK